MSDWSSCWGGMGMGWGWGMGFGWIIMLFFWVLVIAGVVALVRWIGDRPQAARGALDILQERYARGEIQRDEYEQKKRDIGG